MAFYPVEIEACPGFGFTGGPEFLTNIKSLQSGRESRNADWPICRHRYSVPFNNINDTAYLNIKRVFLVVRGMAHTFLHKDWGDYQAVDEPFGIGDGSENEFQLIKVSTADVGEYTRVITKPKAGVVVMADGVPVAATVDTLTGIVTFSVAPGVGDVLTWTGEFYVHVRFNSDQLPFSLDNRMSGGFANNGSVELIEVLGE